MPTLALLCPMSSFAPNQSPQLRRLSKSTTVLFEVCVKEPGTSSNWELSKNPYDVHPHTSTRKNSISSSF